MFRVLVLMLVFSIFFVKNVKVLGKCQLKEVVQEKEGGLNAPGKLRKFGI